jgi:hypothetical protein
MSINESIDYSDVELIKLVQAYHERWGIENGFKDDKMKFIRRTRSRKSTFRQWNLLTGMMLYNCWHVARLRLIMERERKEFWNRVSWDPQRPYLRRKLERNYSDLLSAESFLLHLLEYGIKLRLKQILINKEKNN